jgi:DNA ligase D-like protein (predicted polymerase)
VHVAEKPAEIQVGDRVVRVSNPSREIFPAHAGEAAITKLEVVEYYVAVGEQICRATYERPTTLERWPKGVFEGAVLSTRTDNKGDAFFQKRIPQGAPDWVQTARIAFPSGRTESAVLAWAAQMGTITFHPWPVRRADVEHPDELRLDLDPQPGADFSDAVLVAGELRALLDEIGVTAFPKTSGGRGLHVYVRVEPRWTFTDMRYAAIAIRVTTRWWKEERPSGSVFVDYNQNARDRTIACAYSLRPRPGAPASTPLTWDELADADPRECTLRTVPGLVARRGDPHAAMDERTYGIEPMLEWHARAAREGLGDMPYPPDYPKMPGEPKRVQPSRARP